MPVPWKLKEKNSIDFSGSGYDRLYENLNLNTPLTGSMFEIIEQDNPE